MRLVHRPPSVVAGNFVTLRSMITSADSASPPPDIIITSASPMSRISPLHSFLHPATMDQISDPVAPISFKKRSAKAKSSFRKKVPSPPPASDSDSEFSSFEEEEDGRRIKRRRKNAVVTASSKVASANRPDIQEVPEISASVRRPADNDATKHANWYDQEGDDELKAANLLGKTRPQPNASDNTPDGVYRGASKYQSFIQKNPDAPSKQFGPIKAPTNIRTVTFTDFAPDVCKDYKQTGFCGFGDNCKFLHAREDYKMGWELDRDWEIQTKGKKIAGRTVASANRDQKVGDDEDDDDDELLESIPFACIICKQPYKNAVVTKCGHYFCEACALQRYRKTPSCAACGSGTGGVFNVAKKLNKLLKKKRERAKIRREKAIEAGEEVSEEESGE